MWVAAVLAVMLLIVVVVVVVEYKLHYHARACSFIPVRFIIWAIVFTTVMSRNVNQRRTSKKTIWRSSNYNIKYSLIRSNICCYNVITWILHIHKNLNSCTLAQIHEFQIALPQTHLSIALFLFLYHHTRFCIRPH